MTEPSKVSGQRVEDVAAATGVHASVVVEHCRHLGIAAAEADDVLSQAEVTQLLESLRPGLTADERADVWAHLAALYEREASLLSAATATGSIGVAIIALGVDTEAGTPLALAASIGPPLILGVFLYLYVQSRITGSYLRRLETALRDELSGRSVKLRVAKVGTVRFPFFASLISAAFAHGRGAFLYRVIFGILAWLAALFIVGGSLAIALSQPPGPYRAVVVAIVGVILLLDLIVFARAATADRFEQLIRDADRVEEERQVRQAPRADPGEMVRLLFFPRPTSLGKGLWIVWGAVAALGLLGAPSAPWPALLGDVLLGFVVLELIGNQGRYLINNLRDRRSDEGSNDPQVTRRVPSRLNYTQLVIVAASLLARLVAVRLLAELASNERAEQLLLWSVVILIGLTVGYELVRDKLRAQASPTGDATVATGPRVAAEAVFLLVAGGYTLRTWLGLALVAATGLPWWLWVALLAGVTAVHYGMVLMGWVLEGMGGIPASGELPARRFGGSLATKPHLRQLVIEGRLLAPGARRGHVGHGRRMTPPLALEAFRNSGAFRGRIFLPTTLGAAAVLAAVIAHVVLTRPLPAGSAALVGVALVVAVTLRGGVASRAWVTVPAQDGQRDHDGASRRRWIAGVLKLIALLALLDVLVEGPAAAMDRVALWAGTVATRLAQSGVADIAWLLLTGVAAAVLPWRLYGDSRSTAGMSLHQLRALPHTYAGLGLRVISAVALWPLQLLFGRQVSDPPQRAAEALALIEQRIALAAQRGIPVEAVHVEGVDDVEPEVAVKPRGLILEPRLRPRPVAAADPPPPATG